MADAGKKMHSPKAGPKGHQHISDEDPDEMLEQDDLADDIKGNNQLQGNDQLNVRNERHTQADATRDTEGVVESFEKQDPKARAKD